MANLSSPLGTTLYHSPPLSRQRPISPLPLGNTLPLVSFRQILSSPLGSTSRQYPSSPLGNTSRCRCSIVSSFIISSESCYLGNTLPTLCLGNGQSPLLSGSATPYLASPPLTSRQHPTSPLNSATAHLSSQMIHKTPAAPASNNDPLLAEGAAHQTTLPVRKEPLTHDPSHAGGAAHSPNDTPLAGGAAPSKPDPTLPLRKVPRPHDPTLPARETPLTLQTTLPMREAPLPSNPSPLPHGKTSQQVLLAKPLLSYRHQPISPLDRHQPISPLASSQLATANLSSALISATTPLGDTRPLNSSG